jgi:hypothetical protein
LAGAGEDRKDKDDAEKQNKLFCHSEFLIHSS